jgi:glycosyltransferase involved in cell wall biosynthesis
LEELLVSIVTPSYNQAEFIEKTIQSVLNQSYKNIEYIIVDGKSTDNTKDILKRYKDYLDFNIKIIEEKDTGQSNAINKGFKIANGTLVGWINSDDILKPDCVSNIVDSYLKNKDATVFYGDIDLINEDGEYINTLKAKDISYNSLLYKNPDVYQPGSFYNNAKTKEVGYVDESIHFTMDYDLWLRLLKNSRAVRIPKVLAEFRLQPNSKTMGTGNWKKFWNNIYSVRREKHGVKFISTMDFYFIKWFVKTTYSKLFNKLGK